MTKEEALDLIKQFATSALGNGLFKDFETVAAVSVAIATIEKSFVSPSDGNNEYS